VVKKELAERERYTFSALISLLIQCENKLETFYQGEAEKTKSAKLKPLFKDFSEKNKEHKDKMEKTRRETLVEMALEPITGLNLNEHLAQIDSIIKKHNMDSVEKTIVLEEIMQKLYSEASSKVINASAETGELLRKLSEESVDRRLMMERIGRASL